MTKTGDAARPTLETPAESAADWARSHIRLLGLGAIGLAVVVAGFFLVRSSNEKKEMSADRALGDAQRSVASGNLPLAAADLEKLVQQHGSTRAGTQGRLLLAQVYFQQEKVAEGLKVLDETRSAGILQASVHALRAAGLEESGKPAEAAEEYLKASRATELESERESYKADAARAYLAANKRDEAVKIWQGMADDPTSPLNAEARLRVGELTASVVTR